MLPLLTPLDDRLDFTDVGLSPVDDGLGLIDVKLDVIDVRLGVSLGREVGSHGRGCVGGDNRSRSGHLHISCLEAVSFLLFRGANMRLSGWLSNWWW